MVPPRDPLPFRRLPEPPRRVRPAGPAKTRGPARGVGLYVGLACILAIALILMPSLQESTDGALIARARSDCISIGSAVLRFQKDTGVAPHWFRAIDADTSSATRVMVIVGPGRIPREFGTHGWTTAATDELLTQLSTNGPRYALPGPGGTLGWNGPYLSPNQIAPDPWNNRYFVNAGLLDSLSSSQGRAERKAVWVLSAGPNGTIETALSQTADGARLGGDDIAYRLQ